MDLLEGWLRQHVHQALTEALRWKIDASKSFTLLENARFEDEGSNLRIKSTEKFLVQITKVCIQLLSVDSSIDALCRSSKQQVPLQYGSRIHRHT